LSEQNSDSPNKMRGLGSDELRRHNLALVLDQVHSVGPLSRSRLTNNTGLNRSTIADLVAELSSLGLVEESPGRASTGPGRPSPLVRARPERAVVLAIELSVDSIAVATVGLGGHFFNEVRVARPRERFSPEETVTDVVKLAEPQLAALPTPSALVGVGVGVVGLTRRSDGFVHLAPNLGWRNVPLGSMIGDALGRSVPVEVANDADLGALAEHRRGIGIGIDDLIYISGEAGIGIGIIHNSLPMLGSAGFAGEAGHTLINPRGHQCRCGATGCWETEAGEAALIRLTGLPSTATGQTLLDLVVARAAAGDQRILRALSEIGTWLGKGLGNLVNLFNPELIVLGGFFHVLAHYLESGASESVQAVALAAPRALVRIEPSALGPDAVLIGAAELALRGVIADPAGVERAVRSAVG
jgi:predicted NBD/HSP70 family sugar kinase